MTEVITLHNYVLINKLLTVGELHNKNDINYMSLKNNIDLQKPKEFERSHKTLTVQQKCSLIFYQQ